MAMASGFRIVGGGPEGAAERGAEEHELQPGDHRRGRDEDDHRQHADAETLDDLQAFDLDRAAGEFARIGGEGFEQRILDDDRQTKRHQKRRQDIGPQRQVEQAALQRIADGEHHRHDHHQAHERVEAQPLGDRQTDERGKHDEVAVGDIDEPHHPEDQRQPAGKERVKPAQQHPLHDRVDPIHAVVPRVSHRS